MNVGRADNKEAMRQVFDATHERETAETVKSFPLGTVLGSDLVDYTFEVVGHDGTLVTLRRSDSGEEQKLSTEHINYYIDNGRMAIRA